MRISFLRLHPISTDTSQVSRIVYIRQSSQARDCRQRNSLQLAAPFQSLLPLLWALLKVCRIHPLLLFWNSVSQLDQDQCSVHLAWSASVKMAVWETADPELESWDWFGNHSLALGPRMPTLHVFLGYQGLHFWKLFKCFNPWQLSFFMMLQSCCKFCQQQGPVKLTHCLYDTTHQSSQIAFFLA